VNLTSPDLLRRVRAEYLEMPGLQLTALQAQCLFGLDRESCATILGTLLATKFLVRTPTGLFAMGNQGLAGEYLSERTGDEVVLMKEDSGRLTFRAQLQRD
jgi:hypothetical protein